MSAVRYWATAADPKPWRAGFSGTALEPLYFSCARCRRPDAPIAAFLATAPVPESILDVAVVRIASGGFDPALYCPDCAPIAEAEFCAAATSVEEVSP